ncbi:DUF1629 domain-containing protein [Xanthomonas codiaei]|uniref:DUF1629 domain-containing protein n=1 Tax=Xanthomonas codiaei TaxID=56463 RepID=A0A2S7CR51_9XANT|nr:DUF1629 domain-containing protein [Xanthomonas codiaei]MCC8539653.1 DUF1629 domain-containing protein [Xanthomonas codiaei]PPU64064.1 hypothetical protein XcodCFBP4690_10490 [Xanthomonas codiaei]
MNSNLNAAKGLFYILDPDIRGGGPGTDVEIANEEALLTPPRLIIRPVEGGFPTLAETPLLAHARNSKRRPRDLEGGFSGYWLVSERLKRAFESVDAEGFAFVPCDYALPDGSKGPQHYLCDVVRTIFALDKSNSEFQTRIARDHAVNQDVEMITFSGGAKLFFKKELIGDAHVFRMGEDPSSVICDRTMYEAIRSAGIGVKPSSDGLWWKDAADF